MTLGVRAIVYDEQVGTVFLIRHTYVQGWQLPGGGVETGETLREALAKELNEEGNIQLTGDATLFGVYFNRPMSKRDHVALFICPQYRQVSPKMPDHEIADSGFFALNALPQGTTRATRARLAEVFEQVAPSQDW